MKQVTTSFTKRLFVSVGLLLLLITFAGSSASAQSFTLTPHSDTLVSGERNTTIGLWMSVDNVTNDTLHLTYRTIWLTRPSPDWSISMCVGPSCYPEFIDSVDYDLPPMAHDSCALDFYVGATGDTAYAQMYIRRNGVHEVQTQIYRVIWAGTGVTTELLPDSPFLSKVYPNPFNSNSVLRVALPNRGNIAIALYDVMGRLLNTTSIAAVQGMNTVPLQTLLHEQTTGAYFLQVTTPYGKRTHRVTYLR